MENVPGSSGALLDANHSHFLLVDNGTEGKYGVEIDLRSRFEEAVMKLKTDSRSAAGMAAIRNNNYVLHSTIQVHMANVVFR